MNQAPYSTAAGTAASAAVILAYLLSLFNAHVIVGLLGWEPMPDSVSAALVGLLIGWIINYTHGAPQDPPAPVVAKP